MNSSIQVAEYLIEHGADVNAQDKGGLIPLHNASSYGHVEIAALLIKSNASVNATDRWAFTPLHEAAQKGRTQLCTLLLSHGADPSMKNQVKNTLLLGSTKARCRRYRISFYSFFIPLFHCVIVCTRTPSSVTCMTPFNARYPSYLFNLRIVS